MSKKEFQDHMTILTSQFSTLQDLVKSSFGPHCDNCGRGMMDEGYIIMGTKQLCGPCMDHAK